MANSQSQDLNLQRGDRALHSSLQEWMTQQSKCETTDQGNGKALPDKDDDTSRTRQSYFSPSGVSPEHLIHAPSGSSQEPSIDPNQRANVKEAGSRASVERRTFRTAIRGLIIVIAVAAGWQVYRNDQTKDLLKAWGHSLLNRSSAVLDAKQPGSEVAAEPGSKLSDQAVTPSDRVWVATTAHRWHRRLEAAMSTSKHYSSEKLVGTTEYRTLCGAPPSCRRHLAPEIPFRGWLSHHIEAERMQRGETPGILEWLPAVALRLKSRPSLRAPGAAEALRRLSRGFEGGVSIFSRHRDGRLDFGQAASRGSGQYRRGGSRLVREFANNQPIMAAEG